MPEICLRDGAAGAALKAGADDTSILLRACRGNAAMLRSVAGLCRKRGVEGAVLYLAECRARQQRTPFGSLERQPLQMPRGMGLLSLIVRLTSCGGFWLSLLADGAGGARGNTRRSMLWQARPDTQHVRHADMTTLARVEVTIIAED